ncbi:S9 family peptidase [Cyclobacterium qasimii]|uniref:Peptidase S9 n=2 Tax=Cyclobacterium qasimii TaxID=1350429 RepID=A0A512C7R5_9BACT|nr:prolyl oligopeptidase family serine peptidase [Cyclobacterium qasimii]EPR66958.1 putative acylaminoacyl-peptidase [Cyclobacterium qasimii M12-11B]GEO20210.1 peptidase S9 [Cyclobacterium qasimii]
MAFNLAAQQIKPSLSHQDYDRWETIANKQISKDGKWVAMEIALQDGDGRVQLTELAASKKAITIPRAGKAAFSENSRWMIGLIQAEKDSIRQLKLQKVKKEDFPEDSLLLIDLRTDEKIKIPGVGGYKLPKKVKNWYAYQVPSKVDKDTSSIETKTVKSKDEPFVLNIQSFVGDKSYAFETVLDYGFSDDGSKVYLVSKKEDFKVIKLLDLESGIENQLIDSLTAYKFPVFSSNGAQFAVLGSTSSVEEEIKDFQLYLLDGEGEFKHWESIPDQKDHRVSEHFSPSFSDSGEHLFFGWNPLPKTYSYAADSSILEDERVNLDIWGWQDKEIQPMQLKKLEDRERESKVAVYQISKSEIHLLGESLSSDVHFNRFKKGDWAIVRDNSPYRRAYSWDIQIGEDLSRVNLKTGEINLLAENVIGNPRISPAGKFVYWYNAPDSSWQAIDLASKAKIALTSEIKDAFHYELHDSPSLPRSYGSPGWSADDEFFLVYGKYDVWKVDPFKLDQAKNLTRVKGEKSEMTYRLLNLDSEKDYFDMSDEMMLSGFENETKSSGFFRGDWKGDKLPKVLVYGAATYNGLKIAENKKRYIYQKSTFKASPDVYYSDADFHKEHQMSQINKQQEGINWGDVELVDFLSNDGDKMNGLLFKPENFDPNKKYPMMVYFYERRSDALHHYYSPVPSASIINIPYFVSNEYLVFVPDIKYKIGLPGPSAFDCIVPGVQAMIAKGIVDKDNIGIQGQSWGGYQVAYVITQTNMFKAAGAGAPVVNMTSAYGGIRWGTGMSRMFQYEQTQSRIGGTLWEKPLYYIENSPLFYTDRVETPTLIMHNDKDGAVPWYQGIEFFMALKRNDVPSWLLVYNGEDHNLKERKNKKDLSIRLSQFFDHYLKGEKAPLWMTEGIPAIEKGKTLKYELSID